MLDDGTIAPLARFAGLRCAGAETAVPRLGLWSAIRPTGSEPAMFAPKFYVVLQGAKRMTIAGGTYDLGPGDCAVSILGLPFRYEVRRASPKEPYLGVGLTLDPGIVTSVLFDMPDVATQDMPPFTVGSASADIRESMGRLVRLVFAPCDVPILAPLAERELLYRLLNGPQGSTLRRIAEGQGNVAAIRTAAEWIKANAAGPMRVDALAAAVGMSQTSFHRHFKVITGLSPLAYQRHVRLLDAQRRLANGNPVTSVAFGVGYASPSQFSREYKRMFKVPPKEHKAVSSRLDGRHSA